MSNDFIFDKKQVRQHTIYSRFWFAPEGDNGMRLTETEIAPVSRFLFKKTLQLANIKVIHLWLIILLWESTQYYP